MYEGVTSSSVLLLSAVLTLTLDGNVCPMYRPPLLCVYSSLDSRVAVLENQRGWWQEPDDNACYCPLCA
jgi:hypothetical protein